MRAVLRALLSLPFVATAVACPSEAQPPPAQAAKTPAAPAKPLFITGVEDVARCVLAARTKYPDATVVVYVGAEWCEPCQAFHEAVEAGELDDALAGVLFLEFDADRERKAIAAAGYDGRLIPRFALPGADGRFGGEKIEGGIKGDGAVEHIMARLKPLLAKS